MRWVIIRVLRSSLFWWVVMVTWVVWVVFARGDARLELERDGYEDEAWQVEVRNADRLQLLDLRGRDGP